MRHQSKMELAALAALSYLPFLASSPGKVSADSKQALYLDPGRLLAHATDLWDPHVGAGTVPHQNLGYLFPTGPWFWVLDRLGVPDWIAQRLWWGTISLAAVLGARWLFRRLGLGRWGSLAGSLVYVLTPYQLAFTARISVLLLPWAALPWLVGLAMRATRERGWRAPALLALVVLMVGGVNAASLLLVAIGPALWLLLEALRGKDAARQAFAAAGAIGMLSIGLSAWWLVGVRIQARYGLPVLQLTENVRTVAEASTPGDVLRGIGNWFFYGRDRTGYSLDQAAAYRSDGVVVALSYAVPAAALFAAFAVRWVHRAYFALLVVVGTVVSVGAWPSDDPTPYGSLWSRVTTDTSFGLAFRNSPRAVPLVVLGLAGLLAAGVSALPSVPWRRLGAGLTAVLALGALLPVWQDGFLSRGVARPESIPRYWLEATAAMDAGDHGTRVLEIPGSSFAAYRWGNTVDPITPALIERPYLAREVLPAGTPASADLLAAMDRRMQLGILEPTSLVAVARLFGVGTVALRADLEQKGRFDTPPPVSLWHDLTSPLTDGLEPPRTFGPPGGNGDDPDLPSVALFDLEDPQPVVRTAPVQAPVLLAGDGDGIVDAAAAGLIDGTSLLMQSAALDDAELERALDAGAHLVVTDSHRRRIQTWFYSLRDNRGPTEEAGETAYDPTGYDFRLDPFPGSGDDTRTVVEQVGGRAESTSAGGPERPEDRAAHAVDGDVTTAWRVGEVDPRGERLTITPDEPVEATEMRLVQSAIPPGGRPLLRVAVRIDGGSPTPVDLGPESLQPEGQAVPLPDGPVHTVEVEILDTPIDPSGDVLLTPVGLAEVRLGSFTLGEPARVPLDLLQRAGSSAAGHSLDIVLTRLRLYLPGQDRRDDEARLDRRVDLPAQRTFSLTGLAGPIDDSPVTVGTCRDDLVRVDGVPVPSRLEPDGPRLRLDSCAPLLLSRGSHRIEAAAASQTGINIDRLLLASGPDGGPATIGRRGGTRRSPAVSVTRARSSEVDVRIDSDGKPFWLVLGQSNSDGWGASVAGGSAGDRQLVDGYANGWLVRPDGPGTLSVRLRWGPQRLVWAGIGLSLLTLLGVGLVLWRTRGRSADDARAATAPASLAHHASDHPGGRRARSCAAVVGIASLLVAPPAIVALATAACVATGTLRQRWLVLGAAAPAALAASRILERPSLAWFAVSVLAFDVLVETRIGRKPSRQAPAT